ncbi:MAG: pantoate--beta-alanine ligase [Thermodesulfobacteriota bacterium]|nr:pantoate--beta-alanine ligase [Thermodesulfobacteriota bacterium]
MKIIKTVKEMQGFSKRCRSDGKIIAFVPTMGFLHQGHLRLMEEGRRVGDVLVISIFINPTQFGEGEDFERYPKDFSRDTDLAQKVGVDVAFFPSSSDIYPKEYQTYVNVEQVTRNLCGLSRPGHFRGVTTVVAKLFNIVMPHIALFGQKDFQQLITIKRMVRDLSFDIKIMGIPTVREEDGLAMSSRNTYLKPQEREAALCLYRSICKAEHLFKSGENNADNILKEVTRIVKAENLAKIEYIKICDVNTLQDIERIDTEAVLAMAVMIGETRLIDNLVFEYPR